ncbi:MAG TPA: ABC transporter permease, partial [Gaiellaceae bacterium]|nr:ABC transporter permease [Gaiellaceae bacterium]
RRLVAGLVTLIAMITIAFVVFWLTPTKPLRFLYPGQLAPTKYQTSHANHVLGLDKPKIEQWAHYVTHLPRGDFGGRWAATQVTPDQRIIQFPVAALVNPALRMTLSLLVGGAVLVLLLAIPLGAFAGSRVGSIGDRTVSLIALIGICTHPMVIGILVRSLFSTSLHWLPPTGYCPLIKPAGSTGCGGVVDWADHLALPWLTFALLFLALYVRMVRGSVADTLHEDYVRTARAKGAGEVRVIGRHVLPNAGLRVLTMIGMEIGTAIGVCIYIERAYQLPGLASLAVWEMAGNGTALDLPMILAIVFVISAIVVVGNFIVDAIYVYFDPRTTVNTGRPRTTKVAAGGVI